MFNTKKTPKVPTETNFMGEKAFKLSEKEELVSTVMTTFLENGYYEKQSETVDRIKGLIAKCDPLFVAKLAIYTRNDGKMRSVTHLISSELPKYLNNAEWAKRYYDKIVIRPDDMSEILAAYATGNKMDLKEIKKIPNSMKKGFKTALERLDAYQIDKYKMNRRSISLIDLVNLFHPHGTQKNQEAYRRLMNEESLEGLYGSKILEKEMSAAGKKENVDKDTAKKEAIEAVIDNPKGMPIMNLLKNLRNILLYAPNKVNDACNELRTSERILNSRLLPFRFATAYSEIEKVNYNSKDPKTSIAFESDKKTSSISEEQFKKLKKHILNSIECALQIACQNIPQLEGNCAILIDHSGSVRGDSGGSSRVGAFSKTTYAMIGNLFGSMVAYRQKNVYIGLFGDKLIPVPIDRTKKLLDFNKESFELGARCGGGTEAGIYKFMRDVVDEKKKIDNVIVFSDCQIGNGRSFTAWYGYGSERSEGFHELFKKFRSINPNANFIVCNLKQYGGTSVFDRSQRILNIAGWSENIFSLITSNCKGWDAIIKEIEKIEI